MAKDESPRALGRRSRAEATRWLATAATYLASALVHRRRGRALEAAMCLRRHLTCRQHAGWLLRQAAAWEREAADA